MSNAARTDWTGVVFGLSLSYLAAYQLFKLPPVLPTLLQDYGYGRTLAGGFMSIYALVGLLLSLRIGRIIERQGLLPLVFRALLFMLAGNLFALFWPQVGLGMLTARALEGAAFAVLAIAGPVLANHSASAAHLPIVIGLTAAWIPLGQIVATLVAPTALAWQGWQTLWVLAMLATALLGVWVWRLHRRGAHQQFTPAPAPNGRKPALSLVQRRGLLLSAAIFFLWSNQYFAYMTWLPQYLIEVHGLSLGNALAGYLIPVTVLLVFNLIGGWLLRLGLSLGPLLAGSLALQAAVWWLLPVTGGGANGLLSLLVYGASAGITPTCLFALPSALAGRDAAAAAFAILMTGRNLGVLLGPILLAQAFELSGAWTVAAPIFGSSTTLACLLGVGLALRLRA